jgi:uncharacterized protein (DUF58 family)
MLSPELIRTIRRIEIHTRHLVNDSFAGEYQAIFKGRGMEFDEVREYQPGDEVRSIDWNVTARMGKPFVKRYVEERELTVMLAFDASASGLFGTAERFKRALAAEMGAVLAFSAITNNDKVGLLAFTDQVELHIPPRKGRRHVLRLIRDLLAFEPAGRGTDVTLALDRLNRTLKRRAIIFLISDFLTPPENYRSVLQVSNRRHDVIAVNVTDPREEEWPKVGLMALEDAETGEMMMLDTFDANVRQAYRDLALQKQSARERLFRSMRMDVIDIRTNEPYINTLLSFFRRRASRY